jgi:3-oxoadipate enol-lactonase
MTAPLVLLHPLGADRRFWEPVLAELTVPVIALDLPGHGAAPPAPLGSDVAAVADTVAPAIAEQGIPVHLVGMSLGGLVAQQIALAHPELCASVVLVDTVAVYPEPMQAMWRDRAGIARDGAIATLVDPMVEMWFSTDLAASGDPRVAQARDTFAATDPEGYARACEMLAGTDLSGRIHELQVPTAVICGQDDAPPFRAAATWFGAVTGAQVHWLPGRHACAVEFPDLFAGLLEQISGSAALVDRG